MPESLINSRITSDKQIFFINKEKIAGVQNVTMEMPTTASPINFAGIGAGVTSFIPIGEQVGTVQINAFLINQDYFLRHVTGNSLVNGYILRNQPDSGNNYSFLSGYFTSYQCQYSTSQPIPQVSASIKVVGDLGKISTGSFTSIQLQDFNFIATGNFTNNSPKIPNIGSISLGINDFLTNRVLSFNISVETNKVPIYNAGNRRPKRVDIFYPIEVKCDFSFDLGNYDLTFMRNYPSDTKKTIENLNIQVNDYSNGSGITNYNFTNLTLKNVNYEIAVNGNVVVNTAFEGYINR